MLKHGISTIFCRLYNMLYWSNICVYSESVVIWSLVIILKIEASNYIQYNMFICLWNDLS